MKFQVLIENDKDAQDVSSDRGGNEATKTIMMDNKVNVCLS